MPQIINGGKWAENRLRHLRQLREQTSNEDELRLMGTWRVTEVKTDGEHRDPEDMNILFGPFGTMLIADDPARPAKAMVKASAQWTRLRRLSVARAPATVIMLRITKMNRFTSLLPVTLLDCCVLSRGFLIAIRTLCNACD